MNAAATRIAEISDAFWDDVDALRREAEAVMTEDWTGEASASHSALWQEWVESARAVVGALSGDATLLHQAANRFDTAETASADRIAGLNMD